MNWTNVAVGAGQVLIPVITYIAANKWGITGTQLDQWMVGIITVLSTVHSASTTTVTK